MPKKSRNPDRHTYKVAKREMNHRSIYVDKAANEYDLAGVKCFRCKADIEDGPSTLPLSLARTWARQAMMIAHPWDRKFRRQADGSIKQAWIHSHCAIPGDEEFPVTVVAFHRQLAEHSPGTAIPN